MTATPTPQPAAEPAGPANAVPPPVVPYGPPAGATEAGAGVTTVDLSTRSVASTAGKWAIRLLIPIVIRAIFRAIFR